MSKTEAEVMHGSRFRNYKGKCKVCERPVKKKNQKYCANCWRNKIRAEGRRMQREYQERAEADKKTEPALDAPVLV